jgi:starch phosphorylase
MDGANVEIREAVGEENFFLFGLAAAQVQVQLSSGYQPWQIIESDPELRQVLDLIDSVLFSHGDRQQLAPLTSKLRGQDPFLVCTDCGAYLDCQDTVEARYRDTEQWTWMSILNVARIGRFSSDRATREYAEGIWRVQPVPVKG